MLKGLMDHWVPTKAHLSKFWKSDIDIVKNVIDDSKKEINFNNFTFYTKWYTNGIKSDLPFLYNHPDSSNVKTENKWGTQVIEHLHEKGVTVGAMLQMLTFEINLWEKALTLGEWDLRKFAESDLPSSIADFTNVQYIDRMKEIIKEHLKAFPQLDYLFFEFEGLDLEMLGKVYEKWAKKNCKPDSESVNYDIAVRQYCNSIGVKLDLPWSIEGREMLKFYFKRILVKIQNLLKELNYKGEVGVVYQLYGYEAFVFPEVIPDKDWWLLPWWYWVFEPADTPIELIGNRKQVSKQLMKEWKQNNYKVCYIGDVTMGKNGLDSIEEFYEYCSKLKLDGYIGMGNPDCSIGLRWDNVDDESVSAVRELYKNLYA